MVPEDSSAARMPLPGATMAVAILFSSVRFIERSSQNDSALACENRRFSGNCRVNVGRRVKGGGRRVNGWPGWAPFHLAPLLSAEARLRAKADAGRGRIAPG